MTALLKLLLDVTFEPLVKVVAAAIGPMFDGLTLDQFQVVDIVTKVGQQLEGKPVVFEEMGIYSAAEQQEMIEGVAEIISKLLVHYNITGLDVDLGKLLSAVAVRLESRIP